MTIPRPGHADLTGALKYGYRDLRLALERASARETTMRVAVGRICRAYLAQFGITVGGYVVSIGDVDATLPDDLPYPKRFSALQDNDVRCPDPATVERMRRLIWDTMQAKDTLGGVFEVVALGVPPGLGSHVHFDRKLDAQLAAALCPSRRSRAWRSARRSRTRDAPGTQVHDEIVGRGGRLACTGDEPRGRTGRGRQHRRAGRPARRDEAHQHHAGPCSRSTSQRASLRRRATSGPTSLRSRGRS
jgi:chorismate synthase